jgi:hypothetical protein
MYFKSKHAHTHCQGYTPGASLQKLPNSETLSYLEMGWHLGVFKLQKEVS